MHSKSEISDHSVSDSRSRTNAALESKDFCVPIENSCAHNVASTDTSNQLMRIDEGSKGRGLFANIDIPPRTVIHVAPCILVPKTEYDEHMRHTIFEHYLFNAPSGNKLMALGYGSLFNHGKFPNVDYQVDADKLQIVYSTGYKLVRKDVELCITYGATLWFEDADGNDETSCESGDEVDDFLGRILTD